MLHMTCTGLLSVTLCVKTTAQDSLGVHGLKARPQWTLLFSQCSIVMEIVHALNLLSIASFSQQMVFCGGVCLFSQGSVLHVRATTETDDFCCRVR